MERRKWAVITGSTSGIGEEFSRRFYEMGYSLILISRTKEKLLAQRKRLEGSKAPERDIRIEVIEADLGLESGYNHAAERMKEVLTHHEGGETNLPAILINCAGFGALGEFSQISVERQESMVDVNVKALVYLTHEMIPLMEAAGGGRILNVASCAGLIQGGPYMSVYYATKAFVASFTLGIRQELKEAGSPVRVCALCPGPVDTPFFIKADFRHSLPGISTRRCVKVAISGMKRDRALIVPGLSIKAVTLMAKLIPASAMVPLVSHQQKKKI